MAASAYINGARNSEVASLEAANAYLAGAQIGDFDYTRKRGVLYTEFIGPEKYWKDQNSPDRAKFWTDVIEFERLNNRRYYCKKTGEPTASLAREHKVNLPHELPQEVNIQLARAYALEYRRRYGVAGELAVHLPPEKGDSRNIHFHFLHNERAIEQDGKFSDRKAEFTRAHRSSHLSEMREWWALRVQRELQKHHIKSDFDHRSYEARGIKRIPTIHLGPYNSKLEKAGIPTAPGEYNRALYEFYSRRSRLPKEHELEYIKKRASVARSIGKRKSRAHSRTRENKTRKRRIAGMERAFAEVTGRTVGTLSTRERENAEIAKLVVQATRFGIRSLSGKQKKMYETPSPIDLIFAQIDRQSKRDHTRSFFTS